jgi:cytochrome b561
MAAAQWISSTITESDMTMNIKPRMNYILDTIILVLLVIVMVSGLLLWQVVPDGGTRHWGVHAETSSAQTVLGLARTDIRSVHNWAGLLMGGLVLVHLLFHWKWIVCQTRRLLGLPIRPQRQLVSGRERGNKVLP